MDEPNKSTDPIAAACDNEVNNILKEDDEAANEEKNDTASDNTDVEKDASSNFDECDSNNQNDDLAEEVNLNDIEELAEAINGIHDKVTVIENDQTNFIRNTQQRLEEIDNNIKSLMVSLQEIAEQPQQLNELSQSLLKTSSNINTSVTNLQTAFNGINESTTQCIRELQTAANEIPKKLLEDCCQQNKTALETAVSNFNAMNSAAQKWIKKLGNNADLATQIVITSGVITPLLLFLAIMYMILK
ncbi:hypothetical protein [uncultured Phascolarctobacterium sp.]|uniref:hypothetical protein n=1 Tax=uncultured Phascolarctobacterium sp. TaxID=512296 RepID=UPI00260225A8|nr:hypothetical protein [uncultured Phascolarctobacterium sp.]